MVKKARIMCGYNAHRVMLLTRSPFRVVITPMMRKRSGDVFLQQLSIPEMEPRSGVQTADSNQSLSTSSLFLPGSGIARALLREW